MKIIGIDYGSDEAMRGAGLIGTNWFEGAVDPSAANAKKFGPDSGFGKYISGLTGDLMSDSEYNQ